MVAEGCEEMLSITRWFVLLATVVATAVPGIASAQDDGSTNVNEGEGIVIGPFIFSPAIEVTWQRNDNIFFEESTPVEDDIYTAKARLQLELPYHDSYLRFVYHPKYKEYKTYELREKWSHFVDVIGLFEFSSGLKLRPTYRFVSGNLETPEVDPGYEHVYGDWQFNKHELAMAADYWFTYTDGLSLEAGYTDLTYDRNVYFYDYTREYYGLSWIHQLSSTAKLDVRLRRENFDALQTLAYRNSSSDELTIGLSGQLSETLSSELRVGWRQTQYDAVNNDAIEDFSGLVAEGYLSWEMAHSSTLSLELRRWDYPSAWEYNQSYVATGAGLRYNLSLNRLFAQARYYVQDNSYDVVTRDRNDDLTNYGIGLGFWITQNLSLRGNYTVQERDSTLRPFEYDTDVILIGLSYGGMTFGY